MTSYSKVHGAYVETASAVISKPKDSARRRAKVLQSADIDLDATAQAIPESEWNSRFSAAKKALQQAASKHPKGTTFIGLEVQGSVRAILGRKKGAKHGVAEDHFEKSALLEQAAAEGMITRLRPIAEKIRKGTASTETVIAAARNEEDVRKALAIVTTLAETDVPIIIKGKEVMSARESKRKLEKPNSRTPYSLDLSVTSADQETNLVSCRLMGGEGLEAVFAQTDIERRNVNFKASGEALILLGLCSSLGVSAKVKCSVALLLLSKKHEFECGFIALENRADLITRLRLAARQQCPSLFD